MWSAPVIMCDPLLEKSPQVPLIQRDQKVQAFAANRADQSLTERVRLRSLEGRLQYLQVHRLQSRIQLGGVDAVLIVEHKPIGLPTHHDFAELLQSPVGGGMSGDIEMSDPAGSDFQ